MRAGKLRHRVTIQSFTTTENDFGEPEKTWSTFKTRWARVTPVGGGESFQGASRDAEVTHEVEMRHTDGVTAEMRVLYGTRRLHIERTLNPDETGETLMLLCRELVD